MRRHRITVLVPYEFGISPSQRFRWEQWLPHLEAKGLEVELLPFSTPTIGAARAGGAGFTAAFLALRRYLPWLLRVLRAVRGSDLIVSHRGAALAGPPIAEALVATLGAPLVYDLDDALYLAPETGNGFWRRLLRCDWRCAFIGRRAVLVAGGSPVLCDYMRQFNRNVTLWPTTVDTDRCQPRKDRDATTTPIVGWTGSHSTAYYLAQILPELGALQRELPFDFLVIGAEVDLAAHGISGRCVPWSAETEVALTGQIDIGLMPLMDTQWARGKCALKAIQYHAYGAPAVVSDVGVNRDVVLDGETGYLVPPGGDWAPPLRKLLADPELRRRMGAKGRAHMVANYSSVVVADKVARDLRSLLEANGCSSRSQAA
jgi:glycosyltransferase involved in cell wall biosynthesis